MTNPYHQHARPEVAHLVAANLHRPTDPATLAREARRLADQRLTENDIGQALQLDPGTVRRLLAHDMQTDGVKS